MFVCPVTTVNEISVSATVSLVIGLDIYSHIFYVIFSQLSNTKAAYSQREICSSSKNFANDQHRPGDFIKATDYLGTVHHRLEDFNRAKDYYERQKTVKVLSGKPSERIVYGNPGNVYHLRRDFKAVKDYHESHLMIAKELGDISREGTANGNLGNAYSSLGDFKRTIDYHERHLKITKKLCDFSGKGTAYGNLSNVYHCLSREGTAYGDPGNVYSSLGDFETAICHYERHLRIAHEVGDRCGEIVACHNLSKAHHHLGDFEAAIDYLERRREIANELFDSSLKGVGYSNLRISVFFFLFFFFFFSFFFFFFFRGL